MFSMYALSDTHSRPEAPSVLESGVQLYQVGIEARLAKLIPQVDVTKTNP